MEKNIFEGISLDQMIDVNTNNIGGNYETIIKPHETTETEEKETGKEASDLIEVDVSDSSSITKNENTITNIEKPVIVTEETKDEEIKTEDKPPAKTETSVSSPFKVFAKALHEEGVLSSFEDTEFDTEDGATALFNAVANEIKLNVENYKSSLPDPVKRAIDMIEKGYPVEQVFEMHNQEMIYKNIPDTQIEEDENLQKGLIAADLESKGYDSDEIESEIKDYEELGKLDIRAKKAKENLVKYQDKQIQEEAKRAALLAKENQDKFVEEQTKLKEYVDSTNEIIPGTKLTPQVKQKVYESMTKPAGKDKDGRPISHLTAVRSKDPNKFDTIFHYLLVNGVFEGKFDIVSKVTQKATVKELEKSLSDTSMREGTPAQAKSGSTLLESLKEFKR